MLRGGDEIGERLVRGVGLHRDHRGLEHEACDRGEILQGHLGLDAGERIVEPHAGEEADGVRIALFLGEIRRGHGAVATGLVHDLHAHRQQLFLLQHQRDRAREHVAAAAGPGVHHGLDRAGRLEALRERAERTERGERCEHDLLFH